jgi:hypothetical protein
MGMYFNTPNTDTMIKKINQRWFNQYAANTGDAAVLSDTANYPNLYSVVTQLNIHLGGGDEGKWRRWLTNIDVLPFGASTFGPALRAQIATFLNDNINCQGVEFFAVPSGQVTFYVPPNLPVGGSATQYTGCIVVQTLTYDKV